MTAWFPRTKDMKDKEDSYTWITKHIERAAVDKHLKKTEELEASCDRLEKLCNDRAETMIAVGEDIYALANSLNKQPWTSYKAQYVDLMLSMGTRLQGLE